MQIAAHALANKMTLLQIILKSLKELKFDFR